jgi:hypothetical protein
MTHPDDGQPVTVETIHTLIVENLSDSREAVEHLSSVTLNKRGDA